MTQISPAYPLTCKNLGTFHKVQPMPLCRTIVISVTAAAFLALFMAASICGVHIAEYERQVGRRAHSFELNVQVLPLTQRGVWWIGSLTIAVTDGLRGDVAAFDAAIHPIIAELA